MTNAEAKVIMTICREEITNLELRIAGSIDQVGGESELLQRIDILDSVEKMKEAKKNYLEVVKLLNGVKEVDWERITDVMIEIQRNERVYRADVSYIKKTLKQVCRNIASLKGKRKTARIARTAYEALSRERLERYYRFGKDGTIYF